MGCEPRLSMQRWRRTPDADFDAEARQASTGGSRLGWLLAALHGARAERSRILELVYAPVHDMAALAAACPEYWSSGVLCNTDTSDESRFTALSCCFLVRRRALPRVRLWHFGDGGARPPTHATLAHEAARPSQRRRCPRTLPPPALPAGLLPECAPTSSRK